MSLSISLIDSNFLAETFSANTGDQGVSESGQFLLLSGVETVMQLKQFVVCFPLYVCLCPSHIDR